MNKVIKVENLSKKYQLGEIGTGMLSTDLQSRWAKMRGKEDPYSRVGEVNDRTVKGKGDFVLSLSDINFEIEQGDAVGIIGRNGAGKSTLLKILSRITQPTTGSVKIKGRVSSLLEVGTGFHPDLTGRENIFLNGAILGMRKAEVKKRFDEIVDFAGIERYIDTPVKRYSSGMYARLAFGVGAHLESEILIVDEVLAVGDFEFQRKCLGKMSSVSKGEGRTVLFVSHNMGSILQLCNNCILLNNGKLEDTGRPSLLVRKYYSQAVAADLLQVNKNANIYLKRVATYNVDNESTSDFGQTEDIHLRITVAVNKYQPEQNIGLALLSRDKKRIFTVNKLLSEFYRHPDEEVTVDFIIEGGLIAPMTCSFLVALNATIGSEIYDWKEDICPIRIYDDGTKFASEEGTDYGCIILKDKWKLIQN